MDDICEDDINLTFEDSVEHIEHNIIFNDENGTKGKKRKTSNEAVKRYEQPLHVVQANPERNFIRTVPSRSTYSDVASKGKRVTMFGDSIIKRINGKHMVNQVVFNTYVRSFPGFQCFMIMKSKPL